MTLIDRARQFIGAERHVGLTQLLLDCVVAGNSEGLLAVKLLACDTYEGKSLNMLAKGPASCCLLAWGQDGLKALVENTLEEPTSKNFSVAFQLLACTAEGQETQLIKSWVSDGQLLETVFRAVGDWNNLESAARSYLNELVISVEDDNHTALYAGISLFSLSLQNAGALRSMSHALALRSIAVGPRVLETYDRLLIEADDDEPSFQRFFEDHPLLLDPRAFQVWGKADLHGKLEPDFIIRTYDNRYLVVEIETPAKRLVTQQRQLGADATHAVGQILQYQDYLLTHFSAASTVFPEFTRPAGLVVVGRESSLTAGQKAALLSENLSRSDIRIVGFDALAETAGTITRNVIHGIPGAIAGARLP